MVPDYGMGCFNDVMAMEISGYLERASLDWDNSSRLEALNRSVL